MKSSRRQFLRSAGVSTASAMLSARWVNADEVQPGSKIKHRFAVASDLHYGQSGTAFDNFAAEMVGWINKEKEVGGLDAFFLNGDLTHDAPPTLLALRDKHLSKLNVPYYTIKGNHDFVDSKGGSPTESWMSIWGYPANHTVQIGEFVFIMADTSEASKASAYRAVDLEWLQQQLAKHREAPAIFVMIHIPQRKHGVDGWPRHGVHEAGETEKAEAVMALLEGTPNVRAVFHGHNHDETGVYISGNRRYFFDSHAGGSWGATKGYRIVEVLEDHRLVTRQMNAEDRVVLNSHEVPG